MGLSGLFGLSGLSSLENRLTRQSSQTRETSRGSHFTNDELCCGSILRAGQGDVITKAQKRRSAPVRSRALPSLLLAGHTI